MYEIFVSGSGFQFYINDADADILYEGLAKDVRVKRVSLTSTTFYFDNVNGFPSTRGIDFANILDEDGNAFSDIAAFVNFFETKTGFSTALGGSSAGPIVASSFYSVYQGSLNITPIDTFINVGSSNNEYSGNNGSLIILEFSSGVRTESTILSGLAKDRVDGTTADIDMRILSGQLQVRSTAEVIITGAWLRQY